ncbi:hypothetical protein HJG60_008235 [Phyllostomus discolor]|uniref:Uncharacterized protein n=1 Tax=Phyllostomus discolor TaxID=89673 RepID=A0A833Z6N3_9CHIR|nr:hypothetical protein HJG60_008235 [Phyllostomus discolor]
MVGEQYLIPSCCDFCNVLEKWPLFRHWCMEGKRGMSEDVNSHFHIDLHLCGTFSVKMGMPTHPQVMGGLKEATEAFTGESTVTTLATKQSMRVFNRQSKADTFLSSVNPKRQHNISLSKKCFLTC